MERCRVRERRVNRVGGIRKRQNAGGVNYGGLWSLVGVRLVLSLRVFEMFVGLMIRANLFIFPFKLLENFAID